ncbi:mechanosensitive ion channel [Ectothiorhodospiraceae bacterium WFHF3C12]|nr:mechanosensitive ion channel [Ectothiorhodospiraceae bacterium WFHF3C12]
MSLMLCLWPVTAPAQQQAESPADSAGQVAGGASLEQLRKLRDTLSDEAARQELVQQIDALIAVRQSEGAADGETKTDAQGLLDKASLRIEAIAGQITELAISIATLPTMASDVWRRAGDPEELFHWIDEAVRLLGLVIGALAAGWLAGRLTRRGRRAVVATAANSWLFSILAYVLHFLLALTPTAVFAALAYAALPFADMQGATRTLALLLVNSLAIVHAVSVTAHELFRPPGALPAPFRLTQENGAYLAVWLRRFAVVGVYGYFGIEALQAFGLGPAPVAVLERVLGLLVAGMAIVFVMQCRNSVADWLRKDAEPRSLRTRLARTWHYLGLLLIVLVTAVGMVGTADSFAEVAWNLLISILVIFVAGLLAQGVDTLLKRVFALSQELKRIHPLLEARANRYLPVLRKVLRGAIALIAVLALLQVWGLGGMQWLGSDAGRDFGSRLLSIALTVAVALAVWEVVTAIVEEALNRSSPDLDAAAMQRRQTLLPLAKNALRLTLIVLVVLVVFSELGINIAPLLAGAGVIGLAIGFGAQTLVQDLITGVFILLEDSVAVGDFVEVAGYAGTVESLSIRSIRLRDIEGNVHTVPFSQVATVHNMTDKFAYALVDVGVAYRENVDEVSALLKEVGEALQADETWGKDILEGIEIWGLNALSDSSVDIRVRFKVVAGRQWAVRREYLRRVKAAFDERDIEIPFPHRTLYFGVGKQGEAPPARLLLDGDDGATPEPPPADNDDEGEAERGRRKGELGGAQDSGEGVPSN